MEPLLSSFDEPVPLTAIPTNALLNRLEEEENAFIEEYDTDIDTDADSHRRRQQEDEDAKIPLLTSPEVNDFIIYSFYTCSKCLCVFKSMSFTSQSCYVLDRSEFKEKKPTSYQI